MTRAEPSSIASIACALPSESATLSRRQGHGWVVDERSEDETEAQRRRQGYRLPNVLVTDRAGSALVLAALVAIVCALGIVRACQLVILSAPPAGRAGPVDIVRSKPYAWINERAIPA